MTEEQLTKTPEILLTHLDYGDVQNQPKISYEPSLRGQGVFILMKCKQENVRVDYKYGKVRLYSKRKVDILRSIIKESFQFCEGLKIPVFSAPFQTFKAGKKFMALAIRDKDLILTTDEKFKDVIYYQFCKRIPITKNYEIFYTLHELKTKVEEQYKLLI